MAERYGTSTTTWWTTSSGTSLHSTQQTDSLSRRRCCPIRACSGGRARIAPGLTQAELAKRAGLAASAIERYERNDYESASLQRLAELIEAIGITISVGDTSARQAAASRNAFVVKPTKPTNPAESA